MQSNLDTVMEEELESVYHIHIGCQLNSLTHLGCVLYAVSTEFKAHDIC